MGRANIENDFIIKKAHTTITVNVLIVMQKDIWILWIKYFANPTAIAVSYLIEILAMTVILRGWLKIINNSYPNKNCWWEPGKD